MRERTRLTWLAATPVGLLLTLVVSTQVTTVSQNPAHLTAPPAAIPAMTPEPRQPHSTPLATPDFMKCAHPVGSVRIYYADSPGKESAHSDGPALINTDRPASQMQQPNTVNQAIRSFWTRLCTDPVFAAKTAAVFDPKYGNPNATFTNAAWSQALDFIRSQREWSYAKGARLVYATAPKDSWTDYMVPGHGRPARVGYSRYTHGASWLLMVWGKAGPNPEFFRNKCGGQWVGPKARIPTIYHN